MKKLGRFFKTEIINQSKIKVFQKASEEIRSSVTNIIIVKKCD